MNHIRKENIRKNKISELRTYQLGGYRQKVLLEGKTADLPIVLCIHGGPGSPIPFSVGCRGVFPEFTNHFIMVYWDQLGCGINNFVIDNSFSAESFIKMTIDLICQLKADFPNNKLLLFGTSWGSALAAYATKRIPEMIDGIVIYGQILKDIIINDEVRETLIKSKASDRIKKNVEEIIKKKSSDPKDLKKILSFVLRYTDGYQNKNSNKISLVRLATLLLSSPDYHVKDAIAVVRNGYSKNGELFLEITKLDMTNILLGINKPYEIIQGDTDTITSTKVITKLVSSGENPNLHCTIIKNAGHLPNQDSMDMILEKLKYLSKV